MFDEISASAAYCNGFEDCEKLMMKKKKALRDIAIICLNMIQYFMPKLNPDDMVKMLEYLDDIDNILTGKDEGGRWSD